MTIWFDLYLKYIKSLIYKWAILLYENNLTNVINVYVCYLEDVCVEFIDFDGNFVVKLFIIGALEDLFNVIGNLISISFFIIKRKKKTLHTLH